MGLFTDIEWCDSTLNLMAGCDGCELWTAERKICYAGVMTGRYGGRKGWPAAFDQPALFLERLDDALRWADLTGTDREGKPWLNGRPRIIFLDDMGDTFTESLPLDWLAQPYGPRVCPKGHRAPRVQYLEKDGVCVCTKCGTEWTAASALELMARTPHQWLLLTKRGSRMRQFSERYPLPKNVWPGVSVTSRKTVKRIDELCHVKGGGPKWISAEPLWESIDFSPWMEPLGTEWVEQIPVGRSGGSPLAMVIFGGQSGPDAAETNLTNIRLGINQCRSAGVLAFIKQLGSNVHAPNDQVADWFDLCWHLRQDETERRQGATGRVRGFRDPKGGDPDEWPMDIRVREFPNDGPSYA